MSETSEELIHELDALKRSVWEMQMKVAALKGPSEENNTFSNIEEMGEMLAALMEKQNKMESTFGVEKVNVKDAGDRIVVTIDTSFGTITAHAEKGTHSPVTYSGSTVVGTGGPTPGVGGTKGGGPHGMTPEQLQEFKKQSLQIGAAQQKLRELETRLNDAAMAIKRFGDKSEDMEEKGAENVKELYACIDSINTSLSEKIALQKVEMQKIAGDQPRPINYDPFNYGEAYAGDLVDFQARKRITELKLLMQGLQTALLQMRDQTKISPTIDLGYKVVRLDQLVGSTGFGQKVDSGEVGPEEVLMVEQSSDRIPGKVEYPRKIMNQTSAEMESKWAITDSIMQTMYRLEMELGEIQRVVERAGLSGGNKAIEELQQALKNINNRQLDLKTVKRLIEDSKESSVNLTAGRKSMAASAQRNTISQVHNDGSDSNLGASRKVDMALRQMRTTINEINQKISSAAKPSPESTVTAAASKKPAQKTASDIQQDAHCLSCHRLVGSGPEQDVTSQPVYSFFNPTGLKPRVRAPATAHILNRTYNIDMGRDKPDVYSIPRPCGAAYTECWPLPKSFESSRFRNLFQTPAFMSETKYIKGTDGRYYREAATNTYGSRRLDVPISILRLQLSASPRSRPPSRYTPTKETKRDAENPETERESGQAPSVVVNTASTEGSAFKFEQQELEEQMERDEALELERRLSLEQKKYKFVMPEDDDEDENKVEAEQAGEPVEAGEIEEKEETVVREEQPEETMAAEEEEFKEEAAEEAMEIKEENP